jgi:tetratricopeptide (TPR) repeat protein
MLKSHFEKLTSVAIAALLVTGAPASALSGAEAAAFESEIGEARTKMMGQSAAALEHARNARKIARGETSEAKLARLTASYLEAEALLRLNRSGEASPILQSTLTEAEGSFEGSKLHADLLRSSASLQARMGQFADALPLFRKAQATYKELGEDRSRAIVLMNIGSLYSGARQFEDALAYFEQGHQAFPEDADFALSVHNNSGNALKGLGRYAEAESAFGRARNTAR